MDGIPPAAKTDAEDVVWALQTADALWKRHERVDAIVWLRRAAQAAAESQNDDRAVDLARSAAELSEWIARNPSPGRSSGHDIEVDDAPLVFEDEIITNARSLAAISGEVLVPPELRAQQDAQLDKQPPGQDRMELPKRVPPSGSESVARPRPQPPRPAPRSGNRTSDPSSERKSPDASGDRKTPASLAPRKAPPPLPPRRPPPPPSPPLPPQRMRREEPPEEPPSARPPASTMIVEEEELLPSLNLSLVEEEEEILGADQDQEEELLGQEEEILGEEPPREPQRTVPAHEPEEELLGEEEPQDPPLPTDASVFDSVTQKIKADLHAIDASLRRTATEETEVLPSDQPTPPPPPDYPMHQQEVPSAPAPKSRGGSTSRGASLDLSSLEAFADLPDDARDAFAAAAEVHELGRDEEASGFALAAIISGEVDVCATIVDAAGERLKAGAVLRAVGSIGIGTPLRLVCASEHAQVAIWEPPAVEEAFRTCPWVEEDLCAAANRTHAVVGATMGPLGERLDATLRKQITDRLDVRALEPGEVLVQKGQAVPGIVLVGAGMLEIEGGRERISSGHFLFPSSILGGGAAPGTARASSEGAIVLFADRMVAHELLVTCPPLLEVLAGM